MLTDELANSFADAPIFGGTLSDSFIHDGGSTSIKVVAAVMVVIMVSTTFLTQRQLMSKNMPADALQGPYAQQQKLLLYILPFTFVLSGPFFPIGVIMYWTTSNIWTMGQQFYVIRNNPAPNTEAARQKEQRDAEKRRARGSARTACRRRPQRLRPRSRRSPPPRQQPKKQSRSQRKKQPPRPQPNQQQNQQNQKQASQASPATRPETPPSDPSDQGEQPHERAAHRRASDDAETATRPSRRRRARGGSSATRRHRDTDERRRWPPTVIESSEAGRGLASDGR